LAADHAAMIAAALADLAAKDIAGEAVPLASHPAVRD
jgi:hypothetical protein